MISTLEDSFFRESRLDLEDINPDPEISSPLAEFRQIV